MSETQLEATVRRLVASTKEMLRLHLPDLDCHISYSAVFCQNNREYKVYCAEALALGGLLASDTATGPVFVVPGVPTSAGILRVIKVRKPDPTRPERGDCDYATADYATLKRNVLGKRGYDLIVRPEFEMIELVDPAFDARVYFSNPPVEEHAGVREALAGGSADAQED